MLLGAASSLSPSASPETTRLRVHGLICAFPLSLGLAASCGSVFPVTSAVAGGISGTPFITIDTELWFGRGYLVLVSALVFVLPFITCFGVDLEKKFWPDGVFKVRRMLIA